MANPYIGLVNAQLLAVRHHLGLLAEETNSNLRLRNRGVLESSVWHLKRGYQYYLWEVGANYQLKSMEDCADANGLAKELTKADKHPGEASELLALEKKGWIADLLAAWVSISSTSESGGAVSSAVTKAPSIDPEGLVLVNLDDRPPDLSSDVISGWLSVFKELIDRQRALMVEY